MPGVRDLLRKTFKGRTDTYLDSALSGNDVLDVTGTFFSDHQRDFTQVRLARYKRNWKFYRGEHYNLNLNDGSRKLSINYCRPIVNKSIDWLFGNGFKFVTPPGNESLIPVLNLVWDGNNQDVMLWEHGQSGGVTGDAYFYVTVEDRGPNEKALPLDEQRIVIRTIHSSYVHPIYESHDPREMQAVLIQFPTILNVDNANQFRNLTMRSARPMGLYSIVMTRAEIVEFWNRDEIPGSRRKNFLRRIPVIHTRNMPVQTSFFGMSDIDDVIPLNEHFNEVVCDVDNIIKYHSAPTTVIFGARAQQLEKGPNKIWSGLPKDAKVQNLLLEGELEASVDHLRTLKLAIMEISNTPESSLGQVQEISNTSAAALEVQYLPLIEKTRRKYTTYGSSIAKVNEIVIQILEERFGMNIDAVVADRDRKYDVRASFNSPLPIDKKLQLDLLNAKIENGLESRAGALRELGEKDIKRKMLEIMADKREVLAEDIERSLGSSGVRPANLNVFSLGSYALNLPELESIFQEQDRALDGLLTTTDKKNEQAVAAAAGQG